MKFLHNEVRGHLDINEYLWLFDWCISVPKSSKGQNGLALNYLLVALKSWSWSFPYDNQS